MKSRTLILADTNGTPQGFVEDPDGRLRSDLGSYRLLSSMPDLLVLRHADDGDKRPAERVLMAGEILTSSTVLEVMNMIVASRWVGTLHVLGPDSHRTFGFDRAALRHATSDHPEDRLDKILFRIGVLTPAQAESVMRELKADQRFGEVLVDRGLIERGKLFEYLQKQMKEIFVSAVLEREGAYVFFVQAEGAPAPSVIAHIPVQQLLFAAAERLDQFKDCQRLIPDLRSRPELAPDVDLTRLRSKDRLVLSYCDGIRTLREIASETWLGRYETLRIVHGYLLKGHLRLLPPARTTEEVADSLAAPFDRALREIFEAVKRNGTLSHLRRDLQGKIDESEHQEHLRRIVSDKGDVDPEGITSWLASLEIRDRMELVGHTLHELASFALFNASLTLPRAEERELAEKVNQHLQQIGAQ